jgi:hypothetical protein
VDIVSIPTSALVAHLRDAVLAKNTNILLGVASIQLKVFSNANCLSSYLAQEEGNPTHHVSQPLDEDLPAAGLGKTKKNCLFVLVPSFEDSPHVINKAFPPLGKRCLYSSAKSTTRKKSIYDLNIQRFSGTFGILDAFKLPHLTPRSSLLWTHTEKGSLPNWSNESRIQSHVEQALRDCSKLSPLLQNVSIHSEQTLFFAQIMGKKKGNRADVVIFVEDTSCITGVAEVKVPGSNMDNVYQIVDYMIDLRNSFNVRFVFGVYTTYEMWKILWFEDSQDAAQCESKQEYDNLCVAGSANDYSITSGTVNIFESKIYQFCDPELVECLATLLYKVSMTSVYNPTKFIEERSRYVYATSKSIQYKSLPKDLKYFKYALPSKRTQNFYILSYFHRGGDGRVALVSSKKGNLGVIKFLHDDGEIDDIQTALSHEQIRWELFWQVQCRIVKINHRSGLLMPFCMTFNQHRFKAGQIPFSSLQTWNKTSPKHIYDSLSDELEGCVNTKALNIFQESPLIGTKEALLSISQKATSHMDICLRHIALLPIWNRETEVYDFKTILIDLTRVESDLDPDVAHARALEDYSILQSELNQLVRDKISLT